MGKIWAGDCFFVRLFKFSLWQPPPPPPPLCNFDPETCCGDTLPLFDYMDGIDPCLCVDSQTNFDRDLAVGMFLISIGLIQLPPASLRAVALFAHDAV